MTNKEETREIIKKIQGRLIEAQKINEQFCDSTLFRFQLNYPIICFSALASSLNRVGQLKAAVHKLFPTEKFKVGNSCHLYGGTVSISWVSEWFRIILCTTVDKFPKSLMKNGCHFEKKTSTEYVYSCPVKES